MSVEQELLLIKGNKELLLAEDVVSWAKAHPNSELHGQFEWDNRKAAGEYRLWQARRLIAIHVSYDGETRRLISLSIDRSRPGGGYRDVSDVLADKSLNDIMLADALAELDRVQLKYERLKALKPLWRVKDRIKRKNLAKHSQAERSAAKQA